MLKFKATFYFLMVLLFVNTKTFAGDILLEESLEDAKSTLPLPQSPLEHPVEAQHPIGSQHQIETQNPEEAQQKKLTTQAQVKPTGVPLPWRIEGGFGFKIYIQPSSNYAKNFFSGPSLNVTGRRQIYLEGQPLQNQYFAQASFDLFSRLENQSGHFFPLLRDAFLESRNIEDSRVLKMGYFLSPIIEKERSFWPGYRLGQERAGLWERYGYLKSTEVGIEYGSIPNDYHWSLGFSNADAENGAAMVQKDIFVTLEALAQGDSSFYSGMSLQKGWYEGLPVGVNNKDRGFVWLGYQNSNGLQITLQGFAAVDAVDGIKHSIAEGADLSDRAGKLVKAAGMGILISKKIEWNSKNLAVDFKLDRLDPDTQKKSDTAHSGSLGLIIPDEIGQFSINIEALGLEAGHSIGNKDRSTLRLDYLLSI